MRGKLNADKLHAWDVATSYAVCLHCIICTCAAYQAHRSLAGCRFTTASVYYSYRCIPSFLPIDLLARLSLQARSSLLGLSLPSF